MKTIVALFDDFNTAQRAVDALANAGVSRDDISIVANNASGEYATTPAVTDGEDAVTAGQGATFGAIVGGLVGLGALLIPGIGPVIAAGPLVALLGAGVGMVAGAATGGITAALVKTGVSEEQAGYYAEGVRRGGALVTVNATDANLDRVQQVLNDHGAADLDQRSSYYQSSGYTGYDATAAPYTPEQVAQEREQVGTFQGTVLGATGAGNAAMSSSAVPYGGLAGFGNAAAAGIAAMSTSVDSDRGSAESDSSVPYGSSAANGMPGWESYEGDFRSRYETNYANTGHTFEQYTPAFQYGYTLANDERYRDYDWDRLEPEARTQWETQHSDSPWESFKDAVRDAWQSVRGAVDPNPNRY